MTVLQSLNRGYNLTVTTVLAFAGLAFGSDAIAEAEFLDKVDDLLLLLVGIIAVVWYNVADNKFRRTWLPVILAGVALLAQIFGVAVEHDDAESIGDNIGGMLLFVPFFVYSLISFLSARKAGASVDPNITA